MDLQQLRQIAATVPAIIVLAVACGADTPNANDAGRVNDSTTVLEPTTTAGDPDPTTTAGDPDPPPTTSQAADDDSDPVVETKACTNDEYGFTLEYPADWSTNSGDVVGACTLFDPDAFEVPDGTDERAAAVSAYVDKVSFAQVAAPDDGTEQRAVTVVDGHQAVRIMGHYDGVGLYPKGTAFTRYVIDLDLGVDDGPGTLFVDVIDVGVADYSAAQRVLDQIVPTIDLHNTAAAAEAIAHYGGGGTPFTVLAEPSGDPERAICLRLDTVGEPTCLSPSEPFATSAATLGDQLSPVLAGTSDPEVFRVEARSTAGEIASYLPVSVAGYDDLHAWAFPFGADDVTELALFVHGGQELDTVPIGSID